jgi:hypothetical protein
MFLKQLQTWFILLVFAFCQIPAGLWHEHEFEICVNPTHQHEEPEHACLVATVLPGNISQAVCKHAQHFTTQTEHCKLCKFEIAKYLECPDAHLEFNLKKILASKQVVYITSHQEYLMRAANKGPPAFFIC